ncbi:YciI family protein [Chelativorans xinjiangense]|uniref:YciI family protein n=1 Tax=Chelativorans xinjiangense TaxID=2681485 RepID=UPI0013583BB5|nr:YciI family protein [Chelativorans xinjiangense]
MPFVVHCIDRLDAEGLRQETRAIHLEYMIRHRAVILFGGPLLAADESRTIGSLMVLDLADGAAVDAFLAGEPYTRAGLFGEVRIEKLRQMVPESRPGLLEDELGREREARRKTT